MSDLEAKAQEWIAKQWPWDVSQGLSSLTALLITVRNEALDAVITNLRGGLSHYTDEGDTGRRIALQIAIRNIEVMKEAPPHVK